MTNNYTQLHLATALISSVYCALFLCQTILIFWAVNQLTSTWRNKCNGRSFVLFPLSKYLLRLRYSLWTSASVEGDDYFDNLSFMFEPIHIRIRVSLQQKKIKRPSTAHRLLRSDWRFNVYIDFKLAAASVSLWINTLMMNEFSNVWKNLGRNWIWFLLPVSKCSCRILTRMLVVYKNIII